MPLHEWLYTPDSIFMAVKQTKPHQLTSGILFSAPSFGAYLIIIVCYQMRILFQLPHCDPCRFLMRNFDRRSFTGRQCSVVDPQFDLEQTMMIRTQSLYHNI